MKLLIDSEIIPPDDSTKINVISLKDKITKIKIKITDPKGKTYSLARKINAYSTTFSYPQDFNSNTKLIGKYKIDLECFSGRRSFQTSKHFFVTNEFAEISPKKITAGTILPVRIIYHVGEMKIKRGGWIIVAERESKGWSTPQIIEPDWMNYLDVKTSGDAKLKIFSYGRDDNCFEPFTWMLKIKVIDGCLKKGDKVIITYGKGIGSYVQTFIEKYKFQLLIAYENYEPIPLKISPSIEILPGRINKLVAVISPVVLSPSSETKLKIRAEDRYGNICEIKKMKNIQILTPKPIKTVKQITTKKVITSKLKVKREGTYQIIVRDRRTKMLLSSSNPIDVRKTPYKLFWGDIHGHTYISDGTGTVDEYFCYAREISNLDFAAVTDHDYSPANFWRPQFITEQQWEETIESAEKNYRPNEFVTLLGYEWAGSPDQTIIYRSKGELFRSNLYENIDALYKKMRKYKGNALVIPQAHTLSKFPDLNTDFTKLLEIHSVWGSSEEAALKYLKRGYKLGFIGSSDDHLGMPGNSNQAKNSWWAHAPGGLVGVYANQLTREEIFKALYKRRCYATTGSRTIIDFKINGHMMGEEIFSNSPPKITVRIIGENPIVVVELIRDGEVIFSTVGDFEKKALSRSTPELTSEFEFVDNEIDEKRGGGVFYYVRVRERDGSLAWSSPIWVKLS